jgi:hypothetical protein
MENFGLNVENNLANFCTIKEILSLQMFKKPQKPKTKHYMDTRGQIFSHLIPDSLLSHT